MATQGNFGNAFNHSSFSYGHARKKWRWYGKQEPAGGTVTNVSDWVDAGVIPSGTPVKFDNTTNTIVAYTDAQVLAAASDITTLGINGYTQEDLRVIDGNTVGSETILYEAELYEFMYADDVLAVLKTLNLPLIHWVR